MKNRTTLYFLIIVLALLAVIGCQYHATHSRGQADLQRVMQESEKQSEHARNKDFFSDAKVVSQPNSSETVYITDTGGCYHRASCSAFRYSQRPIALD